MITYFLSFFKKRPQYAKNRNITSLDHAAIIKILKKKECTDGRNI